MFRLLGVTESFQHGNTDCDGKIWYGLILDIWIPKHHSAEAFEILLATFTPPNPST
jgi:hypothetical protein